jgi:hypothetical protein
VRNTLEQILRERRQQALLADAEFLREYPPCDERVEHARRLLRRVMLEAALGRVTTAERAQVAEILRGVADLRELRPLPVGGHGLLRVLVEDADADSFPGDETWDAMLVRISVPGIVHPINSEAFCHFLEVYRPSCVAGVFLVEIDHGQRLRLVWSNRGQRFCRLLTAEETMALREHLPSVTAIESP